MVEIGGYAHKARDWSAGGACIEGFAEAVAIGNILSGHLYWAGDNRRLGFAAEVMRLDPGGALALRSAEPAAASVARAFPGARLSPNETEGERHDRLQDAHREEGRRRRLADAEPARRAECDEPRTRGRAAGLFRKALHGSFGAHRRHQGRGPRLLRRARSEGPLEPRRQRDERQPAGRSMHKADDRLWAHRRSSALCMDRPAAAASRWRSHPTSGSQARARA